MNVRQQRADWGQERFFPSIESATDGKQGRLALLHHYQTQAPLRWQVIEDTHPVQVLLVLFRYLLGGCLCWENRGDTKAARDSRANVPKIRYFTIFLAEKDLTNTVLLRHSAGRVFFCP